MKIMVIGSGGMLGHITVLYLRERGHEVDDVSQTRAVDERTILMNVLADGALESLSLGSYDAVINCAALLVGPSECNRDMAVLINAWLPHRLETLLSDFKTRLVQVSTDGVFLGSHSPYPESALPDGTSFYARTKSLGEVVGGWILTVRGSFVGPNLSLCGTGLFHWFVLQKTGVVGYQGVRFNAVTSLEFARFIEIALSEKASGLYHIGASETISKAEFLYKTRDVFDLDIDITKDSTVNTDHTLACTRKDIPYQRRNYEDMLLDLRNWIILHRTLYSHYDFLSGGDNLA